MADNEDATTPAAPEEQSQQQQEGEEGATRQHNSDSWVIVDDPDKPAEKSEEQPAEPEPEKPAEPEPEQEPEKPSEPEPEPEKPSEPEPEPESAAEKPAEPELEPEKTAEPEPEPEPEPEKPTDPEPETEKPTEPEVQPEPEPEKPSEPEPEPEKPSEPEPEEKKPSEEEGEAKPEEGGEKKEEETPTAAAEAEQPKEEGTKEEDKPKDEQEKTAESAPAAEEGEKKEQEEKPAEATTSGESRDSVTVEVTVDVSGTTAPAAKEEPKEELPEPGEEIQFGKYLRQLKLGSDLLKIKKTKNFPRIYRLDEDLQSISWNSHHKKAIKAKINVSVITEVRGGKSTDSFKISNSTHSPDLCFSIIYIDGKDSKTLDLVAMTEEERKAWVDGLKALIREEEDKFSTKIRDRWLKDLFDSADKNGDGTLDLKEVLQMMKTLNVGVSKKVVKKMFKDADSDGDYDGKLSFDEFCSLFKELASRPELRRLFYLYSSKMEWWTVQDLQRFLQTEQGADNPSIELCSQIIQRYETTAEGKEQSQMSLDGFTRFMLGPESDIFNVDHREVYQDMSQPLSAYFIASSHNTYLLEDQLKGPSSTEAYINALKRGCRCVELDCWDGPDDEPIIYHGHTLTSKILFKDAIQVIKDYAFQASPYPVILSIENHCGIPQQHRMADIMDEIFGDMLFKAQRDEESHLLPSPNQLKHKILIKGKKLPKSIEAENDDGEVSDEDEAAELDPDQLSKIHPQPAEGEAATEASREQPKAEEKPAEGEGQKEPAAEEAAAATKTEEPPKEEGEEGGDKPKEEEQPKPQEEAEKPKEDEKPKEEEQPKEQPKEGEQEQQAAAASGASAGAEGGEKKEGEGEGEKKEGGEGGEKKEGAEGGSSSLAVPSGSPSKAEKVKRVLSFRSRQKKTPSAAAPAASTQPSKKIKLSYKLSSLINYVQSVHFKGFEGIEDAKCFHMSSFGESSASKFSSSQASKYVQYNRRQLSRTYPAGTRVTSTNYDPLPMWNAGCQIVALNYQTEGKFMDFNDGRFRANGKSGYILKPDYMRQELSRFDHNQRNAHIGGLVPQVLTIKVISGQQLPKPGGSKKGEVIDPYVKIQIGGIGEDCQVVKTKTVDDNGFNPVWNEVFQFIIRNPDLALVRFKVMDKDVNQDDFIGSFCLPFTSIVPGYRHIHLTYAGCRDDRIGNATLFVHVQIQDYVAHKGTHRSRTTLKVKKSRDYPEHALVGHQPIDLLFRNVSGPLHKVVDLKEDFSFALLHFKELCGHGGQADVGECVELLAAKVAAAKLKLQITALKKGESSQVYQAAAVPKEEGKTASVPSMIQQVIEAFNQLNLVARDILEHAQPVAHELENIYKEAEQMKDGLVAHLKETASPPKRFDQVMDHYCRTMHSLNAESADAHELKQEAEKELKKIAAGARSAGLELKAAV